MEIQEYTCTPHSLVHCFQAMLINIPQYSSAATLDLPEPPVAQVSPLSSFLQSQNSPKAQAGATSCLQAHAAAAALGDGS